MKVAIAFDLNANGQGNFLTLDDATKGQLDDADYPLAGEVLVDVTDKVRSVSVSRGRSRDLDKFTAANVNILMDNRGRDFDPLYTAGPYYGQLVPKKRVEVEHLGQMMVTGQVEDWLYDYDVSGDSIAQASCSDGFAQIVNETIAAGTAVSQLSGARVNAILDAIDWPATLRQVSAGYATLDANVIGEDGVDALAYRQQVELSERGLLFIGKGGNVIFRDRVDSQNPATGVAFGSGGIPFVGIDVASTSEEMVNSASVTWTAGSAVAGTAISQDSTSIADYGLLPKTYDTLLADEASAEALAGFIVSRYSRPAYRVDKIGVNLAGMSVLQAQQVLGVELGDVCTVTWTPNGIGDPISQSVIVDAIAHDASPAEHRVTFTLSQAISAFVLDSALFGVLDDDVLGFN